MTLSDMLGDVNVVLLDFDGPVCDVYAGYPATEVARRVIDALAIEDPDDVTDPLEILRRAEGRSGQPAAMRADDILKAAELDAVQSSRPTPGATEVLTACRRAGVPVAIVSNNSEPAIRRYLSLHRLDQLVDGVAGRPHGRPDRMKPHPYLLDQAVSNLRASRDEVVLIGDSATDVEAAMRADFRVIGYANKPGKELHLRQGGAALVVHSMREVAAALATRTLL
ncbi:MAG: HAD family hydrolase [Actinobacteria bacterium]|nr:HAD family hydrolase [Actinomycetota bacterium]